MKLKKLLTPAFILLTLAAVLFIGARSGDFPASLRAMLAIPPGYILLCVACTFGAILMQSVSLDSALRRLGHRLPFGRLFGISILSEFYSYITPGASGGQPMQVYQIGRAHV